MTQDPNQTVPPYASGPMQYQAGPLEPNADARLWGTLAHLASFAGYFIPFGNIIGPLVIWLIKKDEYAFVNDQGKESLNFQITMSIAAIVSAILIIALIGIILLPAVLIFDLVVVIIASVKANQGVAYRYPINFRFIS